jgi:translation initiation factor IF-3
MDYGKHRYQVEKKKKEARKNQKKIEVKEVKFSCKIADNDIAYKVKHAREFLEKGKHVKLRVFLRGREMANPEWVWKYSIVSGRCLRILHSLNPLQSRKAAILICMSLH